MFLLHVQINTISDFEMSLSAYKETIAKRTFLQTLEMKQTLNFQKCVHNK